MATKRTKTKQRAIVRKNPTGGQWVVITVVAAAAAGVWWFRRHLDPNLFS